VITISYSSEIDIFDIDLDVWTWEVDPPLAGFIPGLAEDC